MVQRYTIRIFILLSCTAGLLNAQSLNDYRTIASGAWGDISIWQRYNGAVWEYASVVPDYNSGAIDIRAGHTVTVSAARTIDQTIVRATGELIIENGIPLTVNNGSGDDLTIDGTLTLRGELAGTGTTAVNGTFSWTGGFLSDAGTLDLKAGCSGTISTATAKYIRNGASLVNRGTLTWTGGDIVFVNQAALINQTGATFNLRYDGAMQNAGGGGTRTLVNNGTMTRNTATGGLIIQPAVNNTGTVNVNTGTLSFSGGGTESGEFAIASGATAVFNGENFTFEAASSFSGAGSVTVNGANVDFSGTSTLTGTFTISSGTFNCSSNITLPTLNLSGGYLWGTGEVSVSNSMTWTGGLMWGSGKASILHGATCGISGGVKYVRDGYTFSNHGTTTWTAGDIVFVNQSTIINESDGVFYLQYDGAMQNAGGSGVKTLVNNGIMTRNTASGTLTIVPAFNNSGTININTGTVTFAGGGTETGTYAIASGATAGFTGETFTFGGTSSFSGAGSVTVNGANVDFSGTSTLAGIFTISSGTFNCSSNITLPTMNLSGGYLWGTGEVSISSSMTWTGGLMWGSGKASILHSATCDISGGVKYVRNGYTFSNHGTATWTAGDIVFVNQSTIVNEPDGVFYLRYDGAMQNSGGSGARTLVNNGTMTRNTANGTLSVIVAFNNTGTLNVNTGTLSFSDGGTESGAFIVAGGAGTSFSGGTFTFEAASSFSGAGSVTVNGANVDFSGTSTLTGTFTISSGTFNCSSNITLPTLNLSGGYLWGTGEVSISSEMNWTGGLMWGSGKASILHGATCGISGGVKYVRDGYTFSNHGTATWTAGDIVFVNQSTITNESDGVFYLQYDGAMQNSGGSGVRTLVNNGIMTRNTASGTLTIVSAFNNAGTVNVNTGTLTFANGGSETGTFAIASGATAGFTGETFTFGGTSSFSGAGSVTVNGANVDFSGTSTLTGTFTISSGMFNCISNLSFSNLTIAGGTFTGTGNISVTSLMNWSNGTISGSGSLTLNSGASATFSSGSKLLYTRQFAFSAGSSADWTGGNITLYNDASISVLSGANFNTRAAATMSAGSGTPSLSVAGILTHTSAACTLAVPATVTGTISINSGSFYFTSLSNYGSNTLTNGTFTVGGTLILTGNITTNASYLTLQGSTPQILNSGGQNAIQSLSANAAAGTLRVTGGYNFIINSGYVPTFTNSGTVLVDTGGTLTQGYGVTFTGTGLQQVKGTYAWNGGVLKGGGTTRIDTGGILILGDVYQKNIEGRTIDNYGSIRYTGTGLLYASNTTTSAINNFANGVFDIRAEGSVYTNGSSDTLTVNNFGALQKSLGSGVFQFGARVNINNYGAITVQTGTVRTSGGGASSGSFNALSGALYHIREGAPQWNAGVTCSGGGTVKVEASDYTTAAIYLNDNAAGAIVYSGTTFELGYNGHLRGAGKILVKGTMTWSGGYLKDAGNTIIDTAGTLNISGVYTKYMENRTLTNYGTLTFSGSGPLYGMNTTTATIQNAATGVIDFQSNAGLYTNGSGDTLIISNSGTIRRSTGTGIFTCGARVIVNNNGTLNSQSGTLMLSGGGTSTGNFAAQSGALLHLREGAFYWYAGVTCSGTGTIKLEASDYTNAYLYLMDPVTGAVSQSGTTFELGYQGTIRGGGSMRIKGTMTWSGGTLKESGSFVIDTTGTMNISGVYSKYIEERTLTNHGVINFTGAAPLYATNTTNATIHNSALGTIDFKSDASISTNGSTDSLKIQNYGMVQRTTGWGTFTLNARIVLNNYGTISAQTGILMLRGGGIGTGTYSPIGQGILHFREGVFTLNSGAAISGSGTLKIEAADYSSSTVYINGGAESSPVTSSAIVELGYQATIRGTGILLLNGTFNWNGGSMSDAGITRVANGGTLNFSTSGTKFLQSRAIENYGTIQFTGTGPLYTVNSTSSSLTNFATGIIYLNAGMNIYRYNSNDSMKWYNYGTIRKTGAASTFALNENILMSNYGTIECQEGTLSLGGGGTSNGKYDVSAGAVLQLKNGIHKWTTGFSAEGSGTLRLQASEYSNISVTLSDTGTVATIKPGLTVDLNYYSAVNGTGNLLNKGTLSCFSARLYGTGKIINDTAGTILFPSGASTSYIDDQRIENYGTITWAVGTTFYAVNTTTAAITNYDCGLINFTSTPSLGQYNSTDSLTLNNYGTVRKSGGNGTATIGASIKFFNYGTIEALYNTLHINNLRNYSSGTLTGGKYVIEANLQIGHYNLNPAIVTNNAEILLRGTASQFLNYNGTTALGSFATNAAAGKFSIENGRDFTLSGSTFANNGSFTLNGGDLSLSGTLTLNNYGTFNCGTDTVKGTGSFNNLAGSTLSTAHPQGIASTGASGSIQNSGARSFNSSANYIYNGTAPQITGSGLPLSVTGLTINNPAGVTLSASAVVTNTLTLTNGAAKTGSNTLTLGSGQSNLGTLVRSNGKMVGNLKRWIDTTLTSNILFPVGTDTTYRPVNLTFTTKPTHAGTLTAQFAETNPGRMGLPVNDGGTSIVNIASEGYWSLVGADTLTGGVYNLDITAEGIAGVSNYATLRLLKRAVSGSPWSVQGTHSAGTGTNGIPVVHRTGMSGFSNFTIGGGADNSLGIKQCALKIFIEGFYNPPMNRMTPDTISVQFRNFAAPFALVDSIRAVVDSSGTAVINTTKAANDISYYLVVRHRNSIETWSGQALLFSNGSAAYDMTDGQNKAYGGNLVLKGTKWCIFSGDVNQDGIVDFSDLSAVDNDQFNFLSGYVPTDVTGDDFVDFSDLSICDNNSYNFVSSVTPSAGKTKLPGDRNIKSKMVREE